MSQVVELKTYRDWHARTQEFCPGGGGGGGGPGQSVFLVLSLFYRSQMVNFKEIYYFSRFHRGSNFSRGVQLLISYRNPYNL